MNEQPILSSTHPPLLFCVIAMGMALKKYSMKTPTSSISLFIDGTMAVSTRTQVRPRNVGQGMDSVETSTLPLATLNNKHVSSRGGGGDNGKLTEPPF